MSHERICDYCQEESDTELNEYRACPACAKLEYTCGICGKWSEHSWGGSWEIMPDGEVREVDYCQSCAAAQLEAIPRSHRH